MVFRIYADDDLVYDPYLVHYGHGVLSPKLTLELNKSGSLTFTLPTDNECYNTISKLTSIIRVELNGEFIFKGRVMYDERDFYNRKQIYCEGALSFLLDSQMRPYDIICGVEDFLGIVLANHNNYVDQDKWIELGDVTVLGTEEAVEYSCVDYRDSMETINKELVERYSGFLQVREENGTTYLDYLSAIETVASQPIEFGKNLIDLKEHISAEDVFTVLIPLGNKIKNGEGEDDGRLTIADVNSGNDYLENASGIALFGRIEKTQVWDDITTAQGLLENAQAMLDTGVNTATTITIKAVDLSLLDANVEEFQLGNLVRVVSAPHELDTQFQVTKIEYDILSPDQTVYTFSADFGEPPYKEIESGAAGQDNVEHPSSLRKGPMLRANETERVGFFALDRKTKNPKTLSEKVAREKKRSDEAETVGIYNTVNEARQSAAAMIASGFGGHVYVTADAMYITDNEDIEQATSGWIWNSGGLGFWQSDGHDSITNPTTVLIAMTASGDLVADRITANSITADKIKDATGTDWLTKINTMLAQATSTSNSLKIGDAKAYGDTTSVTFSTNNGWIRFYPKPPTPSSVGNNGNVFCEIQDTSSGGYHRVLYFSGNNDTIRFADI